MEGSKDWETEAPHLWGKADGAGTVWPQEEKIEKRWYLKGVVKRMEPASSWRCQAVKQEAMGRNWSTGNSTLIWGRISLPCKWPCLETDCAEKLWSPLSWRYSKAIRTQSWLMCPRGPCLSKGLGPGDLQRSSDLGHSVKLRKSRISVSVKCQQLNSSVKFSFWSKSSL